ncbi:Uncharacterized protein TCM_004791 [Theobroma cacao]|uniref:Uncharacterized protein n=1 Tax=Theobroma cacao TaxID=3641 RepID=A0A061DS71_THECC|nr:Uncharacterized protein TCM_004791 [Theobroma cacao]
MISVRVAERWRNRRITQPITSLTRPTRMGSRNPKGTGTHPPKEWILSSSGTRGMPGSIIRRTADLLLRKSRHFEDFSRFF